MSKLNVLIVDDHQLFRYGLELMIKSCYQNVIISHSSDGFDAFEKLKVEFFDLILLDINMPKLDGFSLLRKLKNEQLNHKIIILSLSEDPKIIRDSFELGVYCFLSKNCNKEELFKSFEFVRNGEKYYTDHVAKIILGFKEKKEKKKEIINTLSKREIEIFNLVVLDFNNEMISKELNISIRTVEGHRRNIRIKLGLKSVTSMVRFALDHDL